MSKAIYDQLQMVELNDEDLLQLLGFLWESIKATDEAMEADGHIQRLTEELKEYKRENYLEPKKAYKAKLKAARRLAEARGLKFKAPELPHDD